MPKRKPRKQAGFPAALVVLAGVAVLAFAAGEAWLLLSTDAGQLKLARYGIVSDPARVTLLVGRQVRHGLIAYGVPADSIHELAPGPWRPSGDSAARAAPARTVARWRVGLDAEQSPLQANYAVSHFVEMAGGAVLSGRETPGRRGGEILVSLVVGLPDRPTHAITIVRAASAGEDAERPRARIALVLYGLGDDEAGARAMMAIPVPFAVALVPGSPTSGALFRAARAANREIVLHLPLEPINYPQVNPGPGTVLVTMKPAEITGLTRRYLDQAGTVAAVANHMGSLATQDMTVMSAVFRELKRRRLPFIHLSPVAGAVCRPLAAQEGVQYEEPDVLLDAEMRGPDLRPLDRRWEEVLERARTHGPLVVWMRAGPVVPGWLPRAAEARRLKGVDLVPLSSLLRRPAEL